MSERDEAFEQLVEQLGPSVHRSAAVARALERARDHDPHPTVRKVASWYAPGGPIHRKLAPRPRRVRRASLG